jgi:hypothetical protein
VNPSQTIRLIAADASPEVAVRLEQLASEFELQHNQQNNNWAIALGQAQLTWEAGLVNMRLDFANKLELILIEMRKEFRDVDSRLDQLCAQLRADNAISGGDVGR